MAGTIAHATRRVNNTRFFSGGYDAQVNIRDVRRDNLALLLGGRLKRDLARDIRKAPAQVSQWLNHVRTITEETAREIESALGLPEHWMDTPHTSLDDTAPAPAKGIDLPKTPAPPQPPAGANDIHMPRFDKPRAYWWPFSRDLGDAVSRLDQHETRRLENLMRAHLEMTPLPAHFGNRRRG